MYHHKMKSIQKNCTCLPRKGEYARMAARASSSETQSPSRLKINRGEGDGEETGQGARESFQSIVRDANAAYRNATVQTSMISDVDVREFTSSLFNESMWLQRGKHTYEERIEDVRSTITHYLPDLVEKLHMQEEQFITQIEHAVYKKWISKSSADKWMDRLKDPNVHHWKKEQFLTQKFPEYYRNWEKLQEDTDKVQKICNERGINPKDIPEVAVVDAHGFRDMHFGFRRGAVDKALAVLAAYRTNRKDLYDQAKKMLNQAVADDALSKAKIGTWLRRIFESNADPKKIEEFVMGKGKSPLPDLIIKWRIVSDEFDKLEARVKKEGKPPSFSFISKKKFLDMHFDSRIAYLAEAEYRMKDTQLAAIHPLILDIRREIDSKDWNSAQYLIRRAHSLDLSPSDLQRVASLEEYLQRQKSEHGGKNPVESVDPKIELEMLLAQVPAMVQPLFRSAIARGESVTRCLKSLWYNRVWCRQHGYLDDQKEEILRQRSEGDTQKVLKEGHGKGYENMNTRHGRAVVRKYQQGEWAPQLLHYTNDMHESLTEDITTGKDNYAFKYWTTLIPKGVDYETHAYVLRDVFPRIMSCRIDEQKTTPAKDVTQPSRSAAPLYSQSA